MDAGYSARLQQLHERLCRKAKWTITAINLAAAMAAFAPLFGGQGFIAAIAGTVIASLTILDATLNLPERAAQHCAQRKRYLEVLAKTTDSTPLADIDSALFELAGDDPIDLEVLQKPAYNYNVRQYGRDEFVREENWAERFMSALA